MRDDIKNNLAKYSSGQINVCGANHFSANNTKVGRNYGGNKYDNMVLKKEPMKRQSNSQSKDPQGQNGLVTKSHKGTFGAAKRLTNEKADRSKRDKLKMAQRENQILHQ